MTDQPNQEPGNLDELRQVAEEAKAESKTPPDAELFKYLRAGTHSLRDLCDHFGLTPTRMEERLDEFEEDGYLLMRSSGVVAAAKYGKPKITAPALTLADQSTGIMVPVGVISDIHSGSRHAQPSAIKGISRAMYEEHGVRHILQPGDITSGLWIYRGQEDDLLIEARPWSRSRTWQATENQIWLADQYMPKYDGLTWHTMGGNHDWSHVVHGGMDPIRKLSDRRPDIEYYGYDAAGVWLTDKAYVRMWHPRGGVPYAKSYRLQKGLEALAVEALRTAIAREESPVTSMIIAGHLHIAACLPDPPMAGIHPGCFEGQTNLGKQMGLFPALCGVVLKFYLTDGGKVKRIGYDWLFFEEVEDDWRNFPVPDTDLTSFESEGIGPLFTDVDGTTVAKWQDPKEGE